LNRKTVRAEVDMHGTNVLYLVIGALVIAVAALSYQLYQDRHQPQGRLTSGFPSPASKIQKAAKA
jgi:hypothetical protein